MVASTLKDLKRCDSLQITAPLKRFVSKVTAKMSTRNLACGTQLCNVEEQKYWLKRWANYKKITLAKYKKYESDEEKAKEVLKQKKKALSDLSKKASINGGYLVTGDKQDTNLLNKLTSASKEMYASSYKFSDFVMDKTIAGQTSNTLKKIQSSYDDFLKTLKKPLESESNGRKVKGWYHDSFMKLEKNLLKRRYNKEKLRARQMEFLLKLRRSYNKCQTYKKTIVKRLGKITSWPLDVKTRISKCTVKQAVVPYLTQLSQKVMRKYSNDYETCKRNKN